MRAILDRKRDFARLIPPQNGAVYRQDNILFNVDGHEVMPEMPPPAFREPEPEPMPTPDPVAHIRKAFKVPEPQPDSDPGPEANEALPEANGKYIVYGGERITNDRVDDLHWQKMKIILKEHGAVYQDRSQASAAIKELIANADVAS